MKIFNKFKKYIKIAKYGWQYLKTKGFRKKKIKMSRCEAMIKSYLSYSDVVYKGQYHVKLPKGIRKSNNAYIDFMVWQNGKQYAIEYNGEQHYHFVPYFHKTMDKFFEQRKRDKYIERWCKERDIEFVEIPYTWSDDQIISKLKELFG